MISGRTPATPLPPLIPPAASSDPTEVEAVADQPSAPDAGPPLSDNEDPSEAVVGPDEDAGEPDEDAGELDAEATADGEAGEGLTADAGAGMAATTGVAAWTTTPVAPDPEATEAALAALAARPEVTIEPPEGPPLPPPGMDGEPPDEGTPVLLVGGILVGAFIVALAIVILLFRPFDSGSPDVTLSPSPVVTEVPSASPSAEAVVDTPNFQGLSLEEAELTADDYGLVVRVISVENDDVEPGTVLAQQPPPGEAVPVGSTIELSVAVATPTVAVPDIIDLPESEALKALADAGLAAGTRTQASDATIVAGNVISSNPVAASEVARLSAVAYVVSTGPALVAVPDIIDLPESEALKALADAGLAAGTRTQASDATIVAGNVISSNPVAASEVARLSAVAYVVSTGPALVAVPDIIDLPESEALKALADAGLAAGDPHPGQRRHHRGGQRHQLQPRGRLRGGPPLGRRLRRLHGPRAGGRARHHRPARERGPQGPRRCRPGGRDPHPGQRRHHRGGQRHQLQPRGRHRGGPPLGRRLRRLHGPRAGGRADIRGHDAGGRPDGSGFVGSGSQDHLSGDHRGGAEHHPRSGPGIRHDGAGWVHGGRGRRHRTRAGGRARPHERARRRGRAGPRRRPPRGRPLRGLQRRRARR